MAAYTTYNGKLIKFGKKLVTTGAEKPEPPIDDENILIELRSITETNYIEFEAGGEGVISVDWGDGSEIEQYDLEEYPEIHHYYETMPSTPIKISNVSGVTLFDIYNEDDDLYDIKEISIPPTCINLETLYIGSISNINSITLTNLPALYELDINDNINISSITLTNLPALYKLYINDNINISSITLSNLPSLEELTISSLDYCLENLYISDLSSLKNLGLYNFYNLESVTLANLLLISIIDINTCKKLNEINISNLPELYNLDIYDTNISSFILDDTLVNLIYLYIQSTRITSIIIPEELTNLQQIHLRNNNLSSITIPNTLVNLEDISLRNNNLTTFSINSNWEDITEIDLGLNMISNESIINQILIDLSTNSSNNSWSDGGKYLYIDGYKNAAATSDGIIAKNYLEDVGNFIYVTEIPELDYSEISLPSNIIRIFMTDVLDDSYIPSYDAFTLDPKRTITDISFDRDIMYITVDEEYSSEDEISVSYEKPEVNALQAFSGYEVESFISYEVDNQIQTVYIDRGQIDNNPNVITLYTSYSLDNSYIPSFTAFILEPDRTITNILIKNNEIHITVDEDFTYRDDIIISYTKPLVNAIRSNEGYFLMSFEDEEINNYIEEPNMYIIEGYVDNYEPNIIELYTNNELDEDYLPSYDVFTIYPTRNIIDVSIGDEWNTNLMYITVDEDFTYEDKILLSYTIPDPDTSAFRSTNGDLLESVKDLEIDNSIEDPYDVHIKYADVYRYEHNAIYIAVNQNLDDSYIPSYDVFTIYPEKNIIDVSIYKKYGDNNNNIIRIVVDEDFTYEDYNIIISYTIPDPDTSAFRSTNGVLLQSEEEYWVRSYIQAGDKPYVTGGGIGPYDPDTIVLYTDIKLDEDFNIPSTTVFTLDPTRNVIDVSINGNQIYITVDERYFAEDEIYVSYDRPVDNAIQSYEGYKMDSFYNRKLDYNSLLPVPYIVSGEIADNDPSVIMLTSNIALASVPLSPSLFILSGDNTIISVNIYNDMYVKLILTNKYEYGDDNIYISYEKPEDVYDGLFASYGSMPVESFTNLEITNNILQV